MPDILKPDNNLCAILSPSAIGRGWRGWRGGSGGRGAGFGGLLMSLVLPGNKCVFPVGRVLAASPVSDAE